MREFLAVANTGHFVGGPEYALMHRCVELRTMKTASVCIERRVPIFD